MAACGIAPEDDDGNAASRKGPVAASFRSSPTMGAMDELLPEEQTYLRELALELIADCREAPESAVARLEAENLDNEQKIGLWSILDSKTRAAIKKAQQTMKEAA